MADGRLKPGLVTHALAIEQATRAGFAVYDFMAGENRLKASFASHWTRDGLARGAGFVRGLLVGSPACGLEEADASRRSASDAPVLGPGSNPLRCRRGTSYRPATV